MTGRQLLSAQNLIQQNPSLAWSTKSYDQLPIEAVAEAIFNYGSWREFLQLQEILGIQSLARTFAKLDSMPGTISCLSIVIISATISSIMHKNILSENQIAMLPLIKHFSSDYYLVGGTALALQYGHRRSLDFDLFTTQPFETQPIIREIRKIIKSTKSISTNQIS